MLCVEPALSGFPYVAPPAHKVETEPPTRETPSRRLAASGAFFNAREGSNMRSIRTLVLCAAVVTSLLVVTQAQAALFWGNNSTHSIGRATLQGGEVNQGLVGGVIARGGGVAADGRNLFWGTESETIGRSNLEGKEVNASLISPLGFVGGLALAGGKVYWANLTVGVVGRAGLDGAEVERTFVQGGEAAGVAVSSDYVFWTEPGGLIGRQALNGSESNFAFLTEIGTPTGIAVYGNYLYWGNFYANSIGRANLQGGEVNPAFITTGVSHPEGIAVAGGHIYWSNSASESIGRANLQGGEVNGTFVAVAGEPYGLAASEEASPAANAPEFGRCVKEATSTHLYGNASCTVPAATPSHGSYEWHAGPGPKHHFTGHGLAVALETGAGKTVRCGTIKLSGEYLGPKALGNVVISLGKCELSGVKCTTTGASAGTIDTTALTGALVWEKKALKKVAVLLVPAPGAAFAEFKCGTLPVKIVGSTLVPMKSGRMLRTTRDAWSGSRGTQQNAEYELADGSKRRALLEANFAGSRLEYETISLSASSGQTSEELIEVNAAA
jgi:hypothetical protein